MHKAFGKVLLPLFAVVMLLINVAPAQAADTWLPQFDANRRIYVDPGLERHSTAPVNVSGLEQEVIAAERHGVKLFFVVTEKGSDNIPVNEFSARLMDRLLLRWQSASGFPSETYVMVLIVRLDTDVTKTSRAANSGTLVRTYGVEGQTLLNIINAPKDRLARNDVKGYVREVVRQVNERVEAHFQAIEAEKQRQEQEAEAARQRELERQRQAEANAKFWADVKFYGLVIGIPGLILIGLGVFAFMRKRKKEATAKLLEEKRVIVNRLGDRYTELQDNYLGFLNQNLGWEKVFKNRTLREFRAAVAGYSFLTQGKLALSAAFDAAEADFKSGRYDDCVAKLTVLDITVTGDELTVDQRTLFGDTVVKKTFKPDVLMSEMEATYTSTKTKLIAIKAAFGNTKQNRDDTAGICNGVEELKPKLLENDMTFAPWQADYTALQSERDAFLAILDSDPLEAEAKSEDVERKLGELKEHIEKAIELKKSLASSQTVIDDAAAKITKQRAVKVDYAYPDPVKKEEVPQDQPATYQLKEAAANPDKSVSDARESLAQALKAVLEGRLEDANKHKAEAEAHAGRASKLVDDILAAQAYVTKQVPNVRAALGKLNAELKSGDEAVAALNAGFLKKNFEGQPDKVTRAHTVSETTEAELTKVRIAFHEQRFVDARTLLENVGNDIQAARNGIVEVKTRLSQLNENKSHAKATVEAADDLSTTLTEKRETNKHTTSTTTDQAHQTHILTLARQKADVAKDVTDWPAAAVAADKLLADLKAVDAAIDSEKQAYDLAKQRVSDLSTAINTVAGEHAKNEYLRQPAESKLSEARTALGKLRTDLTVAKSDWNAIARRAEAAKSLATEAHNLAESDRQAGTEAEAAIERANEKVASVGGPNRSYKKRKEIGGETKTFGSGIKADVSGANAHLRQADSYFENKKYEKAKESANSAYNAAEAAETKAEEEVNAAIAAAVTAWTIAENARIEREQEAARQAQLNQRRDDGPSTPIGGGVFDTTGTGTVSSGGFDSTPSTPDTTSTGTVSSGGFD